MLRTTFLMIVLHLSIQSFSNTEEDKIFRIEIRYAVLKSVFFIDKDRRGGNGEPRRSHSIAVVADGSGRFLDVISRDEIFGSLNRMVSNGCIEAQQPE